MKANFDFTISARTALLSAVIGFATAKLAALPAWFPADAKEPILTMVGVFAGATYDALAFWVKTRVFGAKIEQE